MDRATSALSTLSLSASESSAACASPGSCSLSAYSGASDGSVTLSTSPTSCACSSSAPAASSPVGTLPFSDCAEDISATSCTPALSSAASGIAASAPEAFSSCSTLIHSFISSGCVDTVDASAARLTLYQGAGRPSGESRSSQFANSGGCSSSPSSSLCPSSPEPAIGNGSPPPGGTPS